MAFKNKNLHIQHRILEPGFVLETRRQLAPCEGLNTSVFTCLAELERERFLLLPRTDDNKNISVFMHER